MFKYSSRSPAEAGWAAAIHCRGAQAAPLRQFLLNLGITGWGRYESLLCSNAHFSSRLARLAWAKIKSCWLSSQKLAHFQNDGIPVLQYR